jgi:hypothetical protein
MSEEQYRKLQTLWKKVTFLPGSWDKRFVRNLSSKAMTDEITEDQAKWIEIVWYRYRKQLGHNDPKPSEAK